MLSYSESKDGGYIILTPKFDQPDVRKISFNGLKIIENDTYFDVFTIVESAERVSKYDETSRKYVDVNINCSDSIHPIARIRLLKKETEVFGKKKEPSIFDNYFIKKIDEINKETDGCIVGVIDMSKGLEGFIEKIFVEKTKNNPSLERIAIFEESLLKYETVDKMDERLESFVVPEIKSYSKRSGGYGNVSTEPEADKLKARKEMITELMSHLYDENDSLWNYAIAYATTILMAKLKVELLEEDKNRVILSDAAKLYLDLVKTIVG